MKTIAGDISSPVGICDWGIGGLGFYRLLRAERPDLDTVYLGDQGAIPYGLLSHRALAQRMTRVLAFFRRQGICRVVVACNAASTVLDSAQVRGVCATGVIVPTLQRILQERPAHIGLIGGRRAVRSLAYARPLRQAGLTVTQRVAQPLSALIEQGKTDAPETAALLRDVLSPLRSADCLVLACTHYIASEPLIRLLLPGVPLLDPAAETGRQIKRELENTPPGRGTSRFCTTGDPAAMQQQAQTVFGVDASVEYVSEL